MIFGGYYIAVAGTLKKPHSHESWKALVVENGGDFSDSVDLDMGVTHLICSTLAFNNKTHKVKAAIEAGSIYIISIDWIMDSIKGGEVLPEEDYLFPDYEHLVDVEMAIGSGVIYVGDIEWISTTPSHVYKVEDVFYDTWLTKESVGEKSSSEILVFKILESDKEPHQYVLSRGDGIITKLIYSSSLPEKLEVLIHVYNSEIQKRESEGYRRVYLDNSIETKIINVAAPSVETLAARDSLYELLGRILSQSKIPTQKLVAKTTEYDALAAKNISGATILAGKKILYRIKSAILENTAASLRAKKPDSEELLVRKEYVSEHISKYYGCIPHISRPSALVDLLDNVKGVEKELDMLKNLVAIRNSAILAHSIGLKTNGHDDILREYFKVLRLVKVDVVDRNSEEFRLIERYFINTGGRVSVNPTWNLQIFRIKRRGDKKRWDAAGWDKMANGNDNRRLLWHGTPMVKISTILQNGLADPNKIGGIFFSDTAQISIDYCRRLSKDTTPFAMILCEVQLGLLKDINNITGAHYSSRGEFGRQRGKIDYKWVNAITVHEDLDGVLMPDVEKQISTSFLHVEWVATKSPSQIKHRYLVTCQP